MCSRFREGQLLPSVASGPPCAGHLGDCHPGQVGRSEGPTASSRVACGGACGTTDAPANCDGSVDHGREDDGSRRPASTAASLIAGSRAAVSKVTVWPVATRSERSASASACAPEVSSAR
jgi:hypothetical protein